MATLPVGGFNANTPTTPGHVFQVTCTADCGSFTWANKTGNLPDIPVDSIIVNPNNAQQVYAGTDWGVYYTDDITVASPTWQRFENGIPHAMVWDMQIDRGSTTLSVWTRSRGAYVYPLPGGGGTPTPTPTSTPTATATHHATATATATARHQDLHPRRGSHRRRGRVLRRRRGHSTQLAAIRNEMQRRRAAAEIASPPTLFGLSRYKLPSCATNPATEFRCPGFYGQTRKNY